MKNFVDRMADSFADELEKIALSKRAGVLSTGAQYAEKQVSTHGLPLLVGGYAALKGKQMLDDRRMGAEYRRQQGQ